MIAEWRGHAGGLYLDGRRAVEQSQQVPGRDHGHAGECREEDQYGRGVAGPVEQGNEEAGAERDDIQTQRLQQGIYHFDSVHSSMLSVFFSW